MSNARPKIDFPMHRLNIGKIYNHKPTKSLAYKGNHSARLEGTAWGYESNTLDFIFKNMFFSLIKQ